LLNEWSRWDGGSYLTIAAQGCRFAAGEPSTVAFWPLYPLLIRVVGWLTGSSDTWSLVVCGLIVSNGSLVVGLAVLVTLALRELDPLTASRAARYLLIFPLSPFPSALYPHSLFLALTVGAIYSARLGRWWLAGALGALGALSRPYGAAIALPLAFEYLSRRGTLPDRPWRVALAVALTPAALAGWGL